MFVTDYSPETAIYVAVEDQLVKGKCISFKKKYINFLYKETRMQTYPEATMVFFLINMPCLQSN